MIVQKQIQSLFDNNRNFTADQSRSRTNNVKNISIYDFVNIFSEQNIFQKQLNFAKMTNRNINDNDRLFFERIGQNQIFENNRKIFFFFQLYQRRFAQNHLSTKQKQNLYLNQFF